MNERTSCQLYGDLPYDESRHRPGGKVTAWSTLAMGALIAASIWGQHAAGADDALFGLDLAIGLAGCALVPVLLRWQIPGALALAVLAAISPAATPPATAGTLIVAQRRRLPVAIAVAAVGVLAHLVRGTWRPASGLSLGWWLVLVLVAHGALVGWGALGRSRRALIASLRERARRAEAEQARLVAEARALERTRIAREMHDVLAHRLSLLATYAGAIEYRPDAPSADLTRATGIIRQTAHDALGDLREVITVLRDDDPAEDAGDERPQPTLTDLSHLLAQSRDAGMDVDLREHLTARDTLTPAAGRTAYRVVQEALTNARKHANGQPVRVTLAGAPGRRLTIEVCNGLPPGPARPLVPGSGLGLVGLTERVRLAGGQLDHEVAAGEFRLRAWLPWPA